MTQVQASGVTSGAPDETPTLLSFLNTGTVVKDAGSSDGTIAWGFSAPDQTFDYLAVGEHLTLQYTVQVTDASGATGTQTVTVTVHGHGRRADHFGDQRRLLRAGRHEQCRQRYGKRRTSASPTST